MYYNNNIFSEVEKETEDLIKSLGQEIYIRYYTSTICPYDGIDQTYKTGYNPSCTTCLGTGYIKLYKPKLIKGFVKSFVGSKTDRDNIYSPIGQIPVGIIRVTFYLPDIVTNVNSANSTTYLDSCEYISVYGKKYSIYDTKKYGIDKNFLIQVLLSEIKG